MADERERDDQNRKDEENRKAEERKAEDNKRFEEWKKDEQKRQDDRKAEDNKRMDENRREENRREEDRREENREQNGAEKKDTHERYEREGGIKGEAPWHGSAPTGRGLKATVDAFEGKRSPELQRMQDRAAMRQMSDTQMHRQDRQLLDRAFTALKESGIQNGGFEHKDELTGKTVEMNLKNGELHSENGKPSFKVTEHQSNGRDKIERAEWHENGQIQKSFNSETGLTNEYKNGELQPIHEGEGKTLSQGNGQEKGDNEQARQERAERIKEQIREAKEKGQDRGKEDRGR